MLALRMALSLAARLLFTGYPQAKKKRLHGGAGAFVQDLGEPKLGRYPRTPM